ncbi:MAG: SAF domain-containing protein [Actinobacteria bacterium]|nr:SAF domain-containing protein [Actinomycetota bacterium]
MKKNIGFRRFKLSKLFSVLGIIFILLALASMYYWETKGRKHFLYSEVVVLNQSVEEGDIITSEMLKIINVDRQSVMEGAITGKDEASGKKAGHFIPGYSQLSSVYFLDEEKVLNQNEYIFTVPENWIITIPNSLRRGDAIYFYPVKIHDEKNDEEGPTQSAQYGSKINLSDHEIKSESSILESRVAYLKDSGNREIVTISSEDRYDASSKIATLEIIATLEDVSYLQDLADNDYKFIILYKDSKI